MEDMNFFLVASASILIQFDREEFSFKYRFFQAGNNSNGILMDLMGSFSYATPNVFVERARENISVCVFYCTIIW